MPWTRATTPRSGQLWLSRPPFVLLVHVLGVDPAHARISYEILDQDGTALTDPVEEALDASWWRNFQLLEPRYG